jgi:hypothetical protein
MRVRGFKGGRVVVASVAVLALASGLAACGGDDDDDAGSTTETTAEGDAESADTDLCDENIELNAALGGLFESEDPAAIQAAYAESGMDELLTEFEENAPAEIAADVSAGVSAIRQLGEEGDPSGIETFDSAEIDGYFFENCDYVTAEVTAKDFLFEGIDEEYDAGSMSFKFTNQGTEVHELAIARKNDGVTESFEELLALPEEEALTKITPVTQGFAGVGETGYATGVLEPGEHIAVCFIPQGTTGETEGTGQPHAMLGMTQEFTVS